MSEGISPIRPYAPYQHTRSLMPKLITFYLLLALPASAYAQDATTTVWASGTVVLALLAALLTWRLRKERQQVHVLRKTLAQEVDVRRALEESNRKLQTAREEAETASRAKNLFLANMSHEIRTPMNVILGYAQVLRRDPDLSSHQRQFLDTIQASGNHLLALIDDILDLSKIEAGRVELDESDFDLQAMVQGMARMFRLSCEERDLAWRVETEGSLGPVRGDERRLRQALISLLDNAVKFTDEGDVSLAVRDKGNYVYEFAIEDTGAGIDQAERERIFEPFHRGASDLSARRRGSGLGLAITRRHIELMGGRLELDSAPGRGSCFHFALVLTPAAGTVRHGKGPQGEVIGLASGLKVRALVVDDGKDDVLGQMLFSVGIEVVAAQSGEQAVERVLETKPDIAFVDVLALDGVELVGRIRAECEAPKMVAVSAAVFEKQQRIFLDGGFDACIDKPLHLPEVCQHIGELLHVEFEYAEEGVAAPAIVGPLQVPDELVGRMRDAAERHSLTRLDVCLEELASLGGAHSRLAARLRLHFRDFDMESILEALGALSHE